MMPTRLLEELMSIKQIRIFETRRTLKRFQKDVEEFFERCDSPHYQRFYRLKGEWNKCEPEPENSPPDGFVYIDDADAKRTLDDYIAYYPEYEALLEAPPGLVVPGEERSGDPSIIITLIFRNAEMDFALYPQGHSSYALFHQGNAFYFHLKEDHLDEREEIYLHY